MSSISALPPNPDLFFSQGGSLTEPILKPTSGIVTFDPSEDTWFWEACWAPSDIPAHVFQADWPESLRPTEKTTADLVAKVAWDLFCLIIFPLALIRLSLSLLHYLGSCVILPTITPSTFHKYIGERILFSNDPLVTHENVTLLKGCGAERVQLATPDGAVLEGALIKGSLHPKKAILFVVGSGSSISHSFMDLHFLAQFGTTVFMINPKGVENSGGTSHPQGMGLDVYTAYQYLIQEMDIPPGDILGHFFSLGGIHGNVGAALIQEEYPDALMKVFDERSPADLISVVNAILSQLPSSTSAVRFVQAVAPSLARASGWQMNGVPAFQRLKGDRCIVYNPSDNLVLTAASKYKKIADQGHPFGHVHCLQMAPNTAANPTDEHLRALNEEERQWQVDQFNILLGLNLDAQQKRIILLKSQLMNACLRYGYFKPSPENPVEEPVEDSGSHA